ncbi:MAG TPA: hypothetical protein VGH32_08635 [Pirellulales bacterium]
MRTSRNALLALIGAGLLLAGYGLAIAVPPPPVADESKEGESLDVQFARMQLALAQASLNDVDSLNSRVAKVVSADDVVAYQQDVTVARSQLKAAEEGDANAEFAVWQRRAEAAASYANALWQGAVSANKRASGTIRATEVERLRLAAELAKLEVKRGEAAVHGTLQQRTAWQLSLLNDEVQRLK